MKRFLIVGAVAIVAAGQALAADLPPPTAPPPRAPAAYVPAPVPFYNWGGIYVGINGGYGFGSTANSTVGVAGNALVPTGTYTLSGNNFSGGLAGGTVGFNYQWAAIVAGIEGDWDWSGQSRSSSVGCGAGCTLNDSSKLPWIATARGRLGYAFDRILVFGTGGVAFTNASDSGSVTTATGTTTLWSPSSTNVGWTAGGGVEVALAPNWTAKAEYLFVRTNVTLNSTINGAAGGGTLSEKTTVNDSLVRAGVNFKFNL